MLPSITDLNDVASRTRNWFVRQRTVRMILHLDLIPARHVTSTNAIQVQVRGVRFHSLPLERGPALIRTKTRGAFFNPPQVVRGSWPSIRRCEDWGELWISTRRRRRGRRRIRLCLSTKARQQPWTILAIQQGQQPGPDTAGESRWEQWAHLLCVVPY